MSVKAPTTTPHSKQITMQKGMPSDYDEVGMTLGDNPMEMLQLPYGLLALEGLPITFNGAQSYPVTHEKMLEAAQYIIENRHTAEQHNTRFHNQADVVAYASQEFGWLTGKDMRLVSVPNYMHLPQAPDAEKQQAVEIADATIAMLRHMAQKDGSWASRVGKREDRAPSNPCLFM
jgi:hypothetical protein